MFCILRNHFNIIPHFEEKINEKIGLYEAIQPYQSLYAVKTRFFVKFWGAKVSMHSWRGHALNTVRVLFRCVC